MLTHLDHLEAEAIHIMQEVAACFEKPCMFYSIGKDSTVMLHTKINKGESVRVFPLSNWTELDIWMYILRENVEIVPLYYSSPRLSWLDDDTGTILALDDDRMLPHLTPSEEASLETRTIRFRTLGCYPQTGAVESTATTASDIVLEMMSVRTSERDGRLLDKDQTASMERKKREGYF